MGSEPLTIGKLAALTQCSVPTIRYYEEIGLLPLALRSSAGRRYYNEKDQKRLQFVKRCRDFGFPIEQVRELASMFEEGERSCVEVRELAQDHLTQVQTKLNELRQLEANLLAFVQSCDEACIGGAARDCTIIEDLSAQPKSRGDGSCCSGAQGDAVGRTASIREVRRS